MTWRHPSLSHSTAKKEIENVSREKESRVTVVLEVQLFAPQFVPILLAVAALAAAALAAPADKEPIKILKSDFKHQSNGGYAYSFETQNGIQQTETGEPKTVNDEENKPHEVVVVRGSYSWTDTEGKVHSVTYVADENGYQPESDNFPKEPIQA